jgi:hypothetical protein
VLHHVAPAAAAASTHAEGYITADVSSFWRTRAPLRGTCGSSSSSSSKCIPHHVSNVDGSCLLGSHQLVAHHMTELELRWLKAVTWRSSPDCTTRRNFPCSCSVTSHEAPAMLLPYKYVGFQACAPCICGNSTCTCQSSPVACCEAPSYHFAELQAGLLLRHADIITSTCQQGGRAELLRACRDHSKPTAGIMFLLTSGMLHSPLTGRSSCYQPAEATKKIKERAEQVPC